MIAGNGNFARSRCPSVSDIRIVHHGIATAAPEELVIAVHRSGTGSCYYCGAFPAVTVRLISRDASPSPFVKFLKSTEAVCVPAETSSGDSDTVTLTLSTRSSLPPEAIAATAFPTSEGIFGNPIIMSCFST